MLYGFQAEQIALAISVWGMAFCSSLARSVAIVDKRRSGGRRDGIAARVAFAATSGFAAVVWIGCIGMVAGNEWLMLNRFWIVCFSAVVGALGPEQQTLFIGSLLDIGQRLLKKDSHKEE